MILPDHEIERRVRIITPEGCLPQCESAPGLLSYGLDSAAYDCRLDYEIRVLRPECAVLDPKQPMDHQFEVRKFEPGQRFYLPPNGFALGVTMERFELPDDVIALVANKSTIARVAMSQTLTKWEAGWEGRATLELCNDAPIPVVLYPGEGICSVVFFQLSSPPRRSYKDKGGKYQGATMIEQAR